MSHAHDQFPNDRRSSEGTWEKLSQVAVKSAIYDSRERQPHPKCLEGTRVDLLNYIYELSDKQEKSQLIWLHGTAGVGKSAVAFTVAERMRGLKVTEETNIETRLAGTFFFSRKNTNRCTTGYLFVTLAYQLASNFPSVREEVNRGVRENPALLDPDSSLRHQMDVLFLQPLRRLQFRLRECPPLSFVIDALDECTSETELVDLISLLAQALRDPDLPVTHILLTSRSEAHIRKAMQEEEVRPLVCEIPVNISGEGIAATISLDGADVDNDIYIFLQHSFAKLRNRHPNFPQPTTDQLARLASRAGRRFVVASTMMKFIDDEDNDPHDRLQLMLELTSKLLPGTEVHKLYDSILSTCSDPSQAYLHLSVVAALASPLPISQIAVLLGPGEGRDVERTLMQLRSIVDIPTDTSLPVNIYHSSIRDYVSDPSNCGFPQVQRLISPHSLLALSSFRLMMRDMPESNALLDALSELKTQSRAMESEDPRRLKQSLAFIVEQPVPLSVLISLQWLRGGYRSELLFWLETLDGRAWLQTQDGTDWLQTRGGSLLKPQSSGDRLPTHGVTYWPLTPQNLTRLLCLISIFRCSSHTETWLETQSQRDWLLAAHPEWARLAGQVVPAVDAEEQPWMQACGKLNWLQTQSGQYWLQTQDGRDWLQTKSGREWLCTKSARDWLWTQNGRYWLQTQDGRDWLQTTSGREWLCTKSGQDWLWTKSGRNWLWTRSGQDWWQTQSGRDWLQTCRGSDWLQIKSESERLQASHGQARQLTAAASVGVTMEEFLTMLDAVSEYMIVSELRLLPAFQIIQQFKSLPDFLMFPVFLALRDRDHSTSVLPQARFPVDMEIIHAMMAFEDFAYKARNRSRSTSGALDYACQYWAFHLSRASNPRDNSLDHMFKSFWDRHLLCWLERQWCLKGLRSCLAVLFEGQELVLPNGQKPRPSESQEFATKHPLSIRNLSILCLLIGLLLAILHKCLQL